MANKRVLIVDDEENIGRSLRLILEREGYHVLVCRSFKDFRTHPEANRAEAYLLDVRLPDGNGIDLLRGIRAAGSTAPVVMISGHGTISDAVEATRAGAFDFLEKPLSRDKVLVTLKNAMEQSTLRQENERLREIVGSVSRTFSDTLAAVPARDVSITCACAVTVTVSVTDSSAMVNSTDRDSPRPTMTPVCCWGLKPVIVAFTV
jgi:two-component system nitrogen regulation response regulator NtrX